MLNVERPRASCIQHSTLNIQHSSSTLHSYPVKFLLLPLLFATAVSAQPPLRVGTVTVRPFDVYSPEEAGRGWLYRVADRLHIDTRRSVIEKFLLFHEGDQYRPELLAQTERNLRSLRFLKSASVVPSAPHDGVVDVVVTTQDAWTIAPETQAGNRGGSSTYGAQLNDSNVLGFGKEVELSWAKGLERSSLGVSYSDPTFFAPYWNADVGSSVNSDGYAHLFSVVRPFYSTTTPWAAEMSFTGFKQDDHLYGDGLEQERFRHHRREIIGSYGVALRATDTEATRLVGGVRLVDNSFDTLGSHPLAVAPEPRQFRYLFVRLDSVQNEFVKLNFVNKDIRFEGFHLGRQTSIEAAVSPRALGVDSNTGFARITASDGRHVGADGFILPAFSVQSRFAGGPAHTI